MLHFHKLHWKPCIVIKIKFTKIICFFGYALVHPEASWFVPENKFLIQPNFVFIFSSFSSQFKICKNEHIPVVFRRKFMSCPIATYILYLKPNASSGTGRNIFIARKYIADKISWIFANAFILVQS